MKPIVVPSAARIEIKSPTQEKKDMSKEDVASVDDLSKRLTGLRNKINKAMTSKNVVDLHQPSTFDSTEIPAFVPTSKVSSYHITYDLQIINVYFSLERRHNATFHPFWDLQTSLVINVYFLVYFFCLLEKCCGI